MKKDIILKKVDLLEGKLRFFRNAILALISSLVWTSYALIENKAGKEVLILGAVGVVVFIFLLIRTKSIEFKQLLLLEELEKKL